MTLNKLIFGLKQLGQLLHHIYCDQQLHMYKVVEVEASDGGFLALFTP
jgi:hypothetical protein